MIGTWVAHIPWLQERLDVSKTTIGFALLCMAAGALVAMPLTGQILDRRESAGVTRAATLVFCLMLPLPLMAPSPEALGAILFVFGAANGAMDVSMNAHGVAVERELGRPIMSSLHGGWSVGGFLSAGLAALAGAAGIDPRAWAAGVGVALWLVSALYLTRRLGSASTHSESAGFALPSRGVILIGALCFLAMVDRGRDRRLERDLPAREPRLEHGRRRDRLHGLQRRDGRRPARRRLAQRAPRSGIAAARRDGGRRRRAGRRPADRRAGAGRDRLRPRRPRHRERRPDPVQRRRPPRALRPVARGGLHRRLHGLHRRPADDRRARRRDRPAGDARAAVPRRALRHRAGRASACATPALRR